jgi:hypothetical protein
MSAHDRSSTERGSPSAHRSSRVISARAVEWVIWIDGIAVDADIKAITAQLDLPFRRVVPPVMKSVQSPLCGAT